MRIIVTDTALIWNYKNPILEQFKDLILVVCLRGKPVFDKYECFVSPYQHIGMGIDQFGVEAQKYKALESVADDLNRVLGYYNKILFLADGNPESLYPFYVIKDRNKYNRLHLCTISPWKFESNRRIKAHKELLSDLSQLESILYINSNDYLSKLEQAKDVMEELIQKVLDEYVALLPKVINSIQDMKEKSYFDFASRSYVPVGEGFDSIDLGKAADEVSEINVPLYRGRCTLGVGIISPKYPTEDNRNKEEIERVYARIDGKKICNYLRQLRIELAKANGIEFFSEECPSIGPCAGTCAKCDREAAYLRDKLANISESERIIPDFKLTKWEV